MIFQQESLKCWGRSGLEEGEAISQAMITLSKLNKSLFAESKLRNVGSKRKKKRGRKSLIWISQCILLVSFGWYLFRVCIGALFPLNQNQKRNHEAELRTQCGVIFLLLGHFPAG